MTVQEKEMRKGKGLNAYGKWPRIHSNTTAAMRA